MSASLKKSFADVTRRKGRTLMVVLGFFIGVRGVRGTRRWRSPAGSGTARGYRSEAAIHKAFGSIGAAPNRQEPQVQDEMALKVQQISQVTTTANALAQTLRAKGVTVLNVSIHQPFNQGRINTINGVFTLLRMLSIHAEMLTGSITLIKVFTLIAVLTS